MFEDEDIEDIDLEKLDEDDWELKFFIWSRKIEEEVHWLEEQGRSIGEIKNFLSNCADLREKFLDPSDLTEVEEYYTEKIHEIWEEYGITDPIF